MASSQDIHIEHPNGSDGWLPAETTPLKQEDPDTPRRSTIGTSKRKKPFRTEQQQGVAPVNDAPAVDEISVEEDLKSRAVSANNNLTPKQRSRIAKSEGQS